MKSLLVAFLIIVSHANALDFDVLIQGAALLSSPAAQKGNLTEVQEKRQLMVLSYYQGFIGTVENSVLLSKPSQHGNYSPQEWMSDEQLAADSLGSFIGDHQTMGREVTPSQVDDLVMAWYLWNCKGAEKLSKAVSVTLLMQVFGRGFPGQKEMVELIAALPPPTAPR
jgi:hypothetical protein